MQAGKWASFSFPSIKIIVGMVTEQERFGLKKLIIQLLKTVTDQVSKEISSKKSILISAPLQIHICYSFTNIC